MRDDGAPVVSIVIPFAGRVEWLDEAVASVLRQTFDLWEIVIVSDEPAFTTEHLTRRDDRIRVLQGSATGPAANRNIGIRASKGTYVAFLDADDMFLPQKLERQLESMREQSASFSHTSYEQCDSNGEFISHVHSGEFSGVVYPTILLRCPVATPTVIARRDLLLDNPFNEELRVGEDTLEWIALARVTGLVGIDETLSRVRMHGANAALDPMAQVAAWRSILEIALPDDTTLPCRARRVTKMEIHRTIALLERQQRRRAAAAGAEVRACLLRGWLRWTDFLTGLAARRHNVRISLRRRRSERWIQTRTGRRDIEWIDRADAYSGEVIQEYLKPARTVLDVGSGIRPQTLVSPKVHVCIEPFEPYIRRLREDLLDDRRFLFLNTTWSRVLPIMPDRSVDCVFALDVIEHLKRREGRRLLAEAVRVARKQVVIFTPLGFYHQAYSRHDTDRWGMGGTRWQRHRSGWCPDDFSTDWHIVACADFHDVDEHGEALLEPFGAFWAIHTQKNENT